MQKLKSNLRIRQTIGLILTLAVALSCFPSQVFAAADYGTHAYFRNGSVLKGSDGKSYYNDSRRYSNRWYTTRWHIDDNCYAQQGPRYAYTLKPKNGGTAYRGYCLEQDISNPNSGNVVYTAQQLENVQYLKHLTDGQVTGIQYALLYGKQPDVSVSDMTKLLGDSVKGCNADDWYVATQAIIWEYQQNLRKEVTSIPSAGKIAEGKIGTTGWRNTPADFFYKPIKNRPAGKVYRAMLNAMREHRTIPSFAASTSKKAKVIAMEKVGDAWWSVNSKYANLSEEEKEAARANEGYYYLTDTKKVQHELKVMKGDAKDKNFIFEKKKTGKDEDSGYKLIFKGDALPEGVQHGKKEIKEATKIKCLAWNVTNGHYQTLAYGADDPVDFYFKLSAKEIPDEPPGEGNPKPEPEFFPSVSFPVHKDDVNPGWDGDHCTGMGDASLGATLVLANGDGEIVDQITLDDYGSTEYLYDMPWTEPADIPSVDSGSYEHMEGDPPAAHCVVQPTRSDWDAEVTYTIYEIVPDGRHPAEFETTKDLPGNITVRATYTVKYHSESINSQTCIKDPENWSEMEYDVTFTDATGSIISLTGKMGEGNLQVDYVHEFEEQVWINDNYRGDLQIVKTKDDQDPFTDKTNSDNGVKEYSTKSKWTIQLKSGGWEEHPYIRVVDEGVRTAAAGEYERYAHVYRVVRDTSGYTADESAPLEVSEDGQIYVYDLPYGTYEVKEISADANGYVLETFEIIVNEHGQKISKAVNNQAKKNKIKVVKTNSETEKTVRWDAERTAFRLKYLGNPDLNDPTVSPNYGKYLPNGSNYTDKDENNFTFFANINGEIVLPYQIEYGIYEIEELTVPKGYFVGQYDDKGIGSIADMGSYDIVNHKGETVKPPKSFLEAVDVRDSKGNKVTEFQGNNKTTYNTYQFRVLEQDPHEDGQEYVSYYAVLDMPNIPAKGKIEIVKDGEGLVGWNQGEGSIWQAIWDRIRLGGTKYEIYAAKDILQSDGVIPVKAFLSADDSEIELIRTSRDHADVDDAKEIWEKKFGDSGTTILQVRDKGIIKDFGKANATVTDFLIKSRSGASYKDSYIVRDEEEKMTYRYTVEYTMNYSKGGFNYTDIHVTKDSVSDDYRAEIPVTEPVIKSGDTELGMLTMNYDNGNLVRMNPLESEGNVTEEEEISGVHSAYNKGDITATAVEPVLPVQATDPETGEPLFEEDGTTPVMTVPLEIIRPAGFTDVKDEDGKFTYEDRVDADQNPLPKFYQVTDGTGNYMIFVKDGEEKRWIPCDKDGNFYKSYSQEYNVTLAQHYDCPDGFSFTWDSAIDLTATADHAAETASTVIKEPEDVDSNPQITETEGIYSHVTGEGSTTFTGKPMDEAFAYFLTHDGIKTEMYLSGGLTFIKVTVTQSQLTAFETVLPMITYNGDDIKWRQLFEGKFDPGKDTFEFIANDRNYVKAVRHEVTPDTKEVYYTIDIVSDNQDYEKGFKLIYPDTTTAVPMVTDSGKGADLRFASIDNTMVYPIGKPVQVIETGLDGIAESDPLPLGEYWVREIASAENHVNKGEWQKMTLSYEEQYTPLVWDEGYYQNDAVSVKIDLEKLFESAYESKEYVPGSGAIFGIYTAEEIKGSTKSEMHVEEKSIPADTLVGRMVVEHGRASATLKLPMGRYYIKEISAPAGYKTNNTKYYFDAFDALTASQMNFHYKDIGVSGFVTQNGENSVVVDFDTLYREMPMVAIIDGNSYDMSENKENSNVKVSVLDGRTNTQIKLSDGQSTTVQFENGAVMVIKAEGQSYTAELSGSQPEELLTGPAGNENFTKDTGVTGKTVIHYTPKVNKTNWLSEVEYKYAEPKKVENPGDLVPIQPSNKVLLLTSPEGTSAVSASVDYEFGSAEISLTGAATSITVDGKAVEDTETPLTIKRITRTEVLDDNGQPKLDADGNPVIKEVINPTKAVINMDDGVTYTVEFDLTGNFYMSAAGSVDKNLDKESMLLIDGEAELPKGINLKNTTAKTFARNNTNAGVLNITIHQVKNDRLPGETPPPDPEEPPVTPPTPDKPAIKTKAMDDWTGTNVTFAGGKAYITDTISYWNLEAGKEYAAKGTLMNPETKKPFVIDGKKVTGEAIFTPAARDGTVEVKFVFDASDLDGMKGVVFEEVLLSGKVIAEHKDWNDENQTIYFPKLKTTAAHTATGVIKDKVDYWQLLKGEEYTLVAVLMDKETKEAVYSKDEKVTNTLTFTADSKDGTVNVPLYFAEADLYGKETVVFEYLYYKGKLVGSHEDWNDKDQTVIFEEPVTPPDEPGKPGLPEKPGKPDIPKTGDTSNLIAYILLAAAALTGLALTARNQNRKKK